MTDGTEHDEELGARFTRGESGSDIEVFAGESEEEPVSLAEGLADLREVLAFLRDHKKIDLFKGDSSGVAPFDRICESCGAKGKRKIALGQIVSSKLLGLPLGDEARELLREERERLERVREARRKQREKEEMEARLREMPLGKRIGVRTTNFVRRSVRYALGRDVVRPERAGGLGVKRWKRQPKAFLSKRRGV